jgi:hypothetical protein
VSVAAAIGAPPYSPYSNEAIDGIYNLLFCDDISAFRPKPGEKSASWQAALFSEPPDISALESLAADVSQEGRIRSLAYQRLRSVGKKVASKVLLGVIVEVPLSEGLDTLAAYSEGGVRYINKAGKLAVFEGVPSLQPAIQDLFKASQPVVDRTGPWDRSRLPPSRIRQHPRHFPGFRWPVCWRRALGANAARPYGRTSHSECNCAIAAGRCDRHETQSTVSQRAGWISRRRNPPRSPIKTRYWNGGLRFR